MNYEIDTNDQSQSTHQYSNLTQNELRKSFLAASNGSPDDGNVFFNKFKYRFDLFAGNYAGALNQGIDLLNRCRAIDDAAYFRIHKGTAYYWIGIAAFLMHEHEIATFFFDAAVSEDLRVGANPNNNLTPSLRYILIDGEAPEQAARLLVQSIQRRLEELIENYNTRLGQIPNFTPLSISELRAYFLKPSISPGGENLRSSATTLISYCMEWDFRNTLFDIGPNQGTAEPFFLHLFKGCVLFESILRANSKKTPPTHYPLSRILDFLHQDLGVASNLNIGNSDLQTIINDLDKADDSIQTAIQFTGRIRNTLGHNLGWVVPINKNHYGMLFRMVSSSCFHAIASLYRLQLN